MGSEDADQDGPPKKRRCVNDNIESPGSKSSGSRSKGPVDIKPGDYADYQRKQRRLSQGQEPGAGLDFESLVKHPGRYGFVDNSRFIPETCDAYLECGKTILIRPRRFGKTTFGLFWLEFFRGNKELFAGLEIAHERVPEPATYMCVHLDLSGARPDTFAKNQLIRALNGALVTARLSRINPEPPTIDTALVDFAEAVKAAGKKAAIFIDEYDYMVMKGNGEAYQQALSTMETLFGDLKAHATVIPFLFVTGSSRIAISGIWSGGNNITDMSYVASMASSLGYTWEQIEKLYSVQLSMLEKLHAMPRAELKGKMETMYNNYRFSPRSDEKVFNVWSINRFMETGELQPHFSKSGLSSALVTGSFPPSTVVAAMAIPGYEYESDMNDLELWRYSPEHASEEFSAVVHLLGAGVLTFSPRDGVWLKVPNDDARCALLNVLHKFARGFDAESFSGMVESGDVCGMVRS